MVYYVLQTQHILSEDMLDKFKTIRSISMKIFKMAVVGNWYVKVIFYT